MIERLTVTDYQKMPWKNGLGYTLELARSAGNDLDDFDWRISMADVTSSGNFSQFHQMKRILTVLEGSGIELKIDADRQRLGCLESVHFSGDSQVSSTLIDGKIRDFNLIYNPKKISARYQWINTSNKFEIFSSAEQIIIFNQNVDDLELRIDQSVLRLKHHESFKINNTKSLVQLLFSGYLSKQCCLIEMNKI